MVKEKLEEICVIVKIIKNNYKFTAIFRINLSTRYGSSLHLAIYIRGVKLIWTSKRGRVVQLQTCSSSGERRKRTTDEQTSSIASYWRNRRNPIGRYSREVRTSCNPMHLMVSMKQTDQAGEIHGSSANFVQLIISIFIQ